MCYQAIETKYFGPTNTKPGRIVAKAWAGKTTYEWDHSINSYENHREAAKKLATLMNWEGEWVMGGNAKADGYVFVALTNNEDSGFKI